MTNEFHTPVLADETIRYLCTRPDGTYVDGTVGGGGHAERILMTAPASILIGFDADGEALESAGRRLARFGDRQRLVHDNVANIGSRLAGMGIGPIDGLLLDLGVSSHQIEAGERGFSYMHDGRLDMRMDTRQSLDAFAVVNTYEQARLADLFWKYGEERNSRKIARAVVDRRRKSPIRTTRELASAVESAAGPRYLMQTLARIFQAIRIEVNRELDKLNKVLEDVIGLLASGGRIVVISYHSLEDRCVKQFFVSRSRRTVPSGSKLVPDRPIVPELAVLTRKPVVPGDAEIERNPRARSAKLRAAERVDYAR